MKKRIEFYDDDDEYFYEEKMFGRTFEIFLEQFSEIGNIKSFNQNEQQQLNEEQQQQVVINSIQEPPTVVGDESAIPNYSTHGEIAINIPRIDGSQKLNDHSSDSIKFTRNIQRTQQSTPILPNDSRNTPLQLSNLPVIQETNLSPQMITSVINEEQTINNQIVIEKQKNIPSGVLDSFKLLLSFRNNVEQTIITMDQIKSKFNGTRIEFALFFKSLIGN